MLAPNGKQHRTMIMRVYVKWRLIFIIGLVVLLVAFSYKAMLFLHSSCDSDQLLMDYCNNPSQPEHGSEGQVANSEYQLLSVHVVMRHGDRSAIHSFPSRHHSKTIHCKVTPEIMQSLPFMNGYLETMLRNTEDGGRKPGQTFAGYDLYPNTEICPKGTLTPYGAAQQVRNGMLLRQKYLDHNLLKSENFEDDVTIRATTYSRTFQSAVAFLYGFLPQLNVGKLHFQVADNNTMCSERSGLGCWCPAVVGGLEVFSCSYKQRDEVKSGFPQEVYNRVIEKIDLSEHLSPKMSHLFDHSVTQFCHNSTVLGDGNCLVNDVFSVINDIGRKSLGDRRYRNLVALKMLPLVNEIVSRMTRHEKSLTTSQHGKFVLYSGHDSTVEPLATMLGIGRGFWPKYASRIVMELYRDRKSRKSFIRVLMDGAVVTHLLKFCHVKVLNMPVGMCSLADFVQFVQHDIYKDLVADTYADACHGDPILPTEERLKDTITELTESNISE